LEKFSSFNFFLVELYAIFLIGDDDEIYITVRCHLIVDFLNIIVTKYKTKCIL